MPSRILAGEVYVITQGSGPPSVNESLAQSLRPQAWADAVSAEILSLGTIRGTSVVVRASRADDFLAIEGGRWVEPPGGDGTWAAAGEGLARRLGLHIGDALALPGSTVARLDVVWIRGLFAAPGLANDELLVDLGTGRFLTGVGPQAYHSIRVATANASALLSFLEGARASVHVSGPDLPRADVNSDPPAGDRFTNLLLRSGRGPVPRDQLTIAVSEATNSVRVVALGLATLIGLLVALGVHAIQARAFADKRASVGILRSVGASDRWMRGRLILETIPTAVGAGLLGAGMAALTEDLRPAASLVLFGHEVRGIFDAGTVAWVVGAIVAASVVSGLLLLEGALRSRPADAVREGIAFERPPALEVVLRG